MYSTIHLAQSFVVKPYGNSSEGQIKYRVRYLALSHLECSIQTDIYLSSRSEVNITGSKDL